MSTIPDRNNIRAFTVYTVETMQAWLNGAIIEFRPRNSNGAWLTPDCWEPTWSWFSDDYRVKPEPPKPTFVPWTFETCPEGIVKVQDKTTGEFGHLSFCTDGALFDTDLDSVAESCPFFEVFERFKRLNGQPCGTEVKP
jgi:hypothetical protein